MHNSLRKIQATFAFTLFAIFACSLTGLAADDSACISCHTDSATLDAMVPVITKVSTGG